MLTLTHYHLSGIIDRQKADSYLKNKWPHNSTYWSEIHYSYGERYKNQSDALWDDQNIIAKVSQLC